MKIRILRVLSVRANGPGVVAFVDDTRVKWNPNGWSCDCEEWQAGEDGDTCAHVEAVCSLLDPRVLGESA